MSLWGYFKFIKGVSFTEGIIGWQTSVRKFLSIQDKQDHQKYTIKLKPTTYPRKPTDVAIHSEPEIIKNYFYKIDLVNGEK